MNHSEKEVIVFISHMVGDRLVAKTLSSTLQKFSLERIRVICSGDFPERTDWLEWTLEQVKQANLFLLILTSHSGIAEVNTPELDWILLESGIFLTNANRHALVVMQQPGVPIVERLKSFRTVRADTTGMANLLRLLFLQGIGESIPIPLNQAIPDEYLLEAANEICDAFPALAEKRIRILTTSLVIDMLREEIQNGVIPSEATVTDNAESWKLFGLMEGRAQTWSELEKFVPGDHAWMEELGLAIQDVADDRIPRPLRGRFEACDGKVYVPVLYRDESLPPATYRVNVVFVPTDAKPIDSHLVFVIMSYQEDMEAVFKRVEKAANKNGLVAKRVKDVIGDYRITNQIIDMIERAKIVVADLTHERPNAYFELGYARALGKKVITTVKQGVEVHFDVKDWTYVSYEDASALETELSARLAVELKHT